MVLSYPIMSGCLSLHPLVCMCIHMFVAMLVHASVCLLVLLCSHKFVCMSASLYSCMSVHMSLGTFRETSVSLLGIHVSVSISVHISSSCLQTYTCL